MGIFDGKLNDSKVVDPKWENFLQLFRLLKTKIYFSLFPSQDININKWCTTELQWLFLRS